MENETKQEIDIEEMKTEITIDILKFIFIQIPWMLLNTILDLCQLVLNFVLLVAVLAIVMCLIPKYPVLLTLKPLMYVGLVAFLGIDLKMIIERLKNTNKGIEESE